MSAEGRGHGWRGRGGGKWTWRGYGRGVASERGNRDKRRGEGEEKMEVERLQKGEWKVRGVIGITQGERERRERREEGKQRKNGCEEDKGYERKGRETGTEKGRE